ncbi:MAG: TauD/TfdA dioxygenase family protein, partial [Pseudomonadales bacterium]
MNSEQDGWNVSRLAGALGAEVHGVDLSTVDDNEFATIESLLLEHLVLFFPAQTLTIDQHVEFGRRFGPLEGHPNLKNPFTEHDELFELAASHGGVADEWHTDLT